MTRTTGPRIACWLVAATLVVGLGAAVFRAATAGVPWLLCPPADGCAHLGPDMQSHPMWRAVAAREHGPPQLVGQVITSDGAAIAGASVHAQDAVSAQRATTGQDGSFVLPRHPAGLTQLRVRAPGYLPLELPRAHLTNPMVVSLWRAYRVDGVVLDAQTRRPLRATVKVRTPDPVSPTVACAEDGCFVADIHAPGCMLVAEHEGYSAKAELASPGGGEVQLLLERAPQGAIRLVDADGKPILGGECIALEYLGDPIETLARADPEGLLRLGLNQDRVLLMASGRAWRVLENPPLRAGETLDITLAEEAPLSGRVLDAAGLAVAGAEVTIGAERVRRKLTADADGRFTVAGWPGGEGTCTAHHPSLGTVVEAAIASGDERVTVALSEQLAGHGVEVHVLRDDGDDRDDGPIVLRFADREGNDLLVAVVDPAASSTTLWLDEEPAKCTATTSLRRAACRSWSSSRPFQRRIEHELRARPLVSGCVLDAWGRPVAGARLRARISGGPLPHPAVAFTDALGRFQVPPTCCELYTVSAQHPTAGHGFAYTSLGDHVHIVMQPPER